MIAFPSGGEVIQGHATLMPSSETLQINANGKAILNWEQFNIAAHEAVRFVQSQETQAILNRVTSGSASEILGSLQSNCPIYLINPQGVFIGSNACIETAGFLASTADFSNEVFWQGSEILFQEFGDGRIVNLGRISASQGDVFLIARGIENQGRIQAPNGSAVLATHEVMLHPNTKECVFIRVDGTEEAGIQNSGSVEALSVELKTRSPYEKAICHTGVIEAVATVEQNGRIYLVAEKGTCEVSGSMIAGGGTVHVLGDRVHLLNGANIDVSGEFGGGTVLIGGDYQGKNSVIQNAKYTWAGKETVVRADALRKGNGGKVVFWADKATCHYGQISVRGGEEGGDGGFAEVSGPILDYQGFTDARAPLGNMGELLLDPNDVEIGTMATTGTFSACGPPSNYNFVNGTATNQILKTDLQTQLAACNVTIDTSSASASGGAGPNNGSITVLSAVTWSANTTLSLIGSSTVTINASITNTSITPGFTAISLVNHGINAGNSTGMNISALVSAVAGDIILFGNSSNTLTTSGSGGALLIRAGGLVRTTSGNIQIAGNIPVGTPIGRGVTFNKANPVQSSSGNIIISGVSNATGTAGNSVGIDMGPFVTDMQTVGTVTFGGTVNNPTSGSPSSISGCQGSGGGITCRSSFFTGGPVIFVD